MAVCAVEFVHSEIVRAKAEYYSLLPWSFALIASFCVKTQEWWLRIQEPMATMLLLWMLIMKLQPMPSNPAVNLASVSLYLSCRRWVLLICFQVLIFAFPLNPFEKKFMLILTDNYVVINFSVINERQHSWFLLLLSSIWYHIDKQISYAKFFFLLGNCGDRTLELTLTYETGHH